MQLTFFGSLLNITHELFFHHQPFEVGMYEK